MAYPVDLYAISDHLMAGSADFPAVREEAEQEPEIERNMPKQRPGVDNR